MRFAERPERWLWQDIRRWNGGLLINFIWNILFYYQKLIFSCLKCHLDMLCLLKLRWNSYIALQAKRFGKKVYWLTLLCVQKWKIFVSTKLTFSSVTTNLALALKVCFIKKNSSHEKSRVLRKDMLHESLQQGITKEI